MMDKVSRDIILLEGNIASGKSTFLNKVSNMEKKVNERTVTIIKEPVKSWTNTPVGNLLMAANSKSISPALFQVSIFNLCYYTIFMFHRHM